MFTPPPAAPAVDQGMIDTLKGLLGIDLLDATRDAELTAYLNTAIRIAEKYCDAYLVYQEAVATFQHDQQSFRLTGGPVAGIVSVTIDGVDELANVDFYTQSNATRLSKWVDDYIHTLRVFKPVEVHYAAGYETVPQDIVYALALIAAALENLQGRAAITTELGTGAIKKKSIVGVGSVEYDVGTTVIGGIGSGSDAHGVIPMQAVALLSSYREISV